MTEKPPPRPPPRPPARPRPDAPTQPPSHAAESTAPRKPAAAPPPLPKKDDDGGATKLFSGNLGTECELEVIQGEFKGKTIKLGAGTVVIGRSSDCDLVLRAASGVSRRHCKVQYLANQFVVIDLESRNGTIVNGQSVERKVLENGDRIEVGDEIMRFVVHSMDDLRDPVHDAPTANVPLPPPAATEVVTRKPPAAPLQTPPQPRAPPPPPDAVIEPFALPPVAPPASEKKGGGAMFFVFGLVVVVVLGGAAFLVYDLFLRGPEPLVAAVVDAGTTAAAPPDAGAVAVVVVDAGTAVAVVAPVVADAGSVVDAGAVAVVVPAAADAGVAVAVVVDAGAAAVAPSAAVQIVRATVSGRAQKVLVGVGDVLKPDTVLVIVDGDNANMRRKLETLRAEEKEFAAVVEKVPSARADLDSVRGEIRKIESRLRPIPQKAGKAGVVVEVLVKVGDVVRDGAPLVKLSPPP
ncbi:MAG: FHA domain-containing protein [Deltaproteobacteria bacterium]|nr:FHA domain-containing protein [Deltaproteobacteria bacterium]